MPVRPSARAAAARPLADDLTQGLAEAGPRAILLWLGAGVGLSIALIALVVIVGNLTDDARSGRARPSRVASAELVTAPAMALATTTPMTPLGPPLTSAPAGTDFELPDDAPLPPRSAAVKKPRGAGKRIIRTAPY